MSLKMRIMIDGLLAMVARPTLGYFLRTCFYSRKRRAALRNGGRFPIGEGTRWRREMLVRVACRERD